MFQEYLRYLHKKLQDNAQKWIEEVSYSITQLAEGYEIPAKDAETDFLGLKDYFKGKGFPYFPNFFDDKINLIEKTKLNLLLLYPGHESKISIEDINTAKIALARDYQKRLQTLSSKPITISIGGSIAAGNAHYWSDVDILIEHNEDSGTIEKNSNNLTCQLPFIPWLSVTKVIPPEELQPKKIIRL